MKHEIAAPTSATVWQVVVDEHAHVTVGDDVVVLEAMKMEIPVPSPATGVVAAVHVEAGGSVREGQILAVVEEGE